MRRRHHSFKERALAILERVAELWAGLFLHLVAPPALNRALRTKEDVDAAERHLFRTDAHISRAIYKTARRLAGLPRIPCSIENFYRPPLKSARHIRWLYLNCTHKLQPAASPSAWPGDGSETTSANNATPLCDLRGDPGEVDGSLLRTFGRFFEFKSECEFTRMGDGGWYETANSSIERSIPAEEYDLYASYKVEKKK